MNNRIIYRPLTATPFKRNAFYMEIHSKSLFYWFILKVFEIQMVNSLFVYETVG